MIIIMNGSVDVVFELVSPVLPVGVACFVDLVGVDFVECFLLDLGFLVALHDVYDLN